MSAVQEGLQSYRRLRERFPWAGTEFAAWSALTAWSPECRDAGEVSELLRALIVAEAGDIVAAAAKGAAR